MKEECCGLFGWLFGHKVRVTMEELDSQFAKDLPRMPGVSFFPDMLKLKVPAAIYCVRCGKQWKVGEEIR